MKRLIISLLILTATNCKAQYAEMGLGTDFKYVTGTMNIGVEINKVVIEGTLSPSLTRWADCDNYFAVKAGINLNGFIPMIGYYYDLISTDNKELNKNLVGYSLKYYRMITDYGGVFGSVLYVNNKARIAFGVRCEIN